MTLQTLERRQVWCYLAAVVLGLLLGSILGGQQLNWAQALIWPALGVLLYATFLQVPLARIRRAGRDTRFLAAACSGNFVVLPLLAWALVQLLPAVEPLRLGMLLVLLVPCTDWFITFAQQGRADAARATALTPLNLLVQLVLLPLYLMVFTGGEAASVVSLGQMLDAGLLIVVPLGLAVLTQQLQWPRVQKQFAWYPVPALSIVILLVAAVNVSEVGGSLAWLPATVGVALAFLTGSLLVAVVLHRLLRLPADAGRTLAFSFGTRNSFVVLPFALALPVGWEAAAVVIVVQSLVELLTMIGWVRLVPAVFPTRGDLQVPQQPRY